MAFIPCSPHASLEKPSSLPPGLGTGHWWLRAGAAIAPVELAIGKAGAAIQTPRCKTPQFEKPVPKVKPSVVSLTKPPIVWYILKSKGKRWTPHPSHHHKMMNRTTATSVPISSASWVSARTTLLSLFILETSESKSIMCTSFPLGCVYITSEQGTIQVIYKL